MPIVFASLFPPFLFRDHVPGCGCPNWGIHLVAGLGSQFRFPWLKNPLCFSASSASLRFNLRAVLCHAASSNQKSPVLRSAFGEGGWTNLDFQDVLTITPAVAIGAADKDIAQELHFDFFETRAAATFALALAGIEAEGAGVEPALFGGF